MTWTRFLRKPVCGCRNPPSPTREIVMTWSSTLADAPDDVAVIFPVLRRHGFRQEKRDHVVNGLDHCQVSCWRRTSSGTAECGVWKRPARSPTPRRRGPGDLRPPTTGRAAPLGGQRVDAGRTHRRRRGPPWRRTSPRTPARSQQARVPCSSTTRGIPVILEGSSLQNPSRDKVIEDGHRTFRHSDAAICHGLRSPLRSKGVRGCQPSTSDWRACWSSALRETSPGRSGRVLRVRAVRRRVAPRTPSTARRTESNTSRIVDLPPRADVEGAAVTAGQRELVGLGPRRRRRRSRAWKGRPRRPRTVFPRSRRREKIAMTPGFARLRSGADRTRSRNAG